MSPLLVIMSINLITVNPVGFNVMSSEENWQHFPLVGYPGSTAPQLKTRLGGITEERIVRYFEPVASVIVSNIDPLLLSTAGLLEACYLHVPADHHLASCIRRDPAFHVEHEAFSGSS